MDFKAKKYLHIHDWNYWWGYYRCGKDWEPFHGAEFSLTEDEAGAASFFHFDFYNLPALRQMIRTVRSGTKTANRTGSSGRCTIRIFHRRRVPVTPPSGAVSR